MNKNTYSCHKTIEIEDACTPPFFRKAPVSFERGKGVRVYDEEGKEYLDLTAGWGVTCLGHTHPVVVDALVEQSEKIMQNPDSGKTYSPARAKLLALLQPQLPHGLTRVFFATSGAEANDAAIKLARKVTGRKNIVSALRSFHGRTIGTTSATGQKAYRERYNVVLPHHIFVPFNDVTAVEEVIKNDVPAVIADGGIVRVAVALVEIAVGAGHGGGFGLGIADNDIQDIEQCARDARVGDIPAIRGDVRVV
jgi:acetylornithine/N-succinyldiaminopimelate aminotransferase